MDDEAFVAAIEESPDDATLKLVYADWLEGRGDPRAELVRLDGELWRMPIELMRVRIVRARCLELRRSCDPRWIVRLTRPSFAELRRRIEILASFMPKHRDAVFECGLHERLAIEQVESLEARLGCRLPEQYRRFVTELADGGVGPESGIARLETIVDSYLADPLPAPSALGAVSSAGAPPGAMPLCASAWGPRYWLVLTGPEAGCMWHEIVWRFSPVLVRGVSDDDGSSSSSDRDMLAMWLASPREVHLQLVDWLAQELDEALCTVARETPDRGDVFERPPAQATDLNLNGRDLTEVPGELRRMTAARALALSGNPIEELPAWIGELGALERLELSFTSLRRLPESLGDLRALSQLSIDHTRTLQQLPESIGRLSRLRSLDLRFCRLIGLPDSIGELPVAELDLFDNRVVRIPASIGRMKLHRLSLCGNRLTELPDELEHLDELTTLELGANAFTVLPGCVARLPRLERLDLRDNAALDLADACRKLQHVRTLRWLSISLEECTALPDEIGLLTQLESLDLRWVADLADACRKLQHVRTLRCLSLFSNVHTALPDEIGLLTQLETLDLHFLQLASLPSSLARLTRLRTIIGLDYNGAIRERVRELLPHLYDGPARSPGDDSRGHL
jgi:uncharacterized protein (TIGR02996 family)